MRSREQKLQIVNEYMKCCSIEERDELVKKYNFKDRIVLSGVVSTYKRFLGIEVKTPNKYNCNTNEEKLALIKRWEEASKEEKEKIAKEYNSTYQRMIMAISSYRKPLYINKPRVLRSDEEKLAMIEEYNNSNIDGHIIMAKKYNLSTTELTNLIYSYRIKFNISDTFTNRFTDEEKICIIQNWYSSSSHEQEAMAIKYRYKNVESMRRAINKFKKQLQEKGLL